jgi:hypothetical protein
VQSADLAGGQVQHLSQDLVGVLADEGRPQVIGPLQPGERQGRAGGA